MTVATSEREVGSACDDWHASAAGIGLPVAPTLGTPFSITAAVDGTVARVTVAGEIDPATVGTFSTVLFTLATDGVEHFIIDASALTFVDSTAVGTLQRLLDAGEGTRVTLSSPSHRLLDLLLATGLDTVITVAEQSTDPRDRERM